MAPPTAESGGFEAPPARGANEAAASSRNDGFLERRRIQDAGVVGFAVQRTFWGVRVEVKERFLGGQLGVWVDCGRVCFEEVGDLLFEIHVIFRQIWNVKILDDREQFG